LSASFERTRARSALRWAHYYRATVSGRLRQGEKTASSGAGIVSSRFRGKTISSKPNHYGVVVIPA
jgi:hypothetical protein